MNVLETAIYDALTGEPAITNLLAGTASVYNRQAPHGASYPLIIFQHQGGGDENKSPHRSRNMVYLIKGITTTGLTDSGAIDAQVDTLLHLQSLTVSGWTNFWLARESPVRYVEQAADGNAYYHAGGLYRVRLAQ